MIHQGNVWQVRDKDQYFHLQGSLESLVRNSFQMQRRMLLEFPVLLLFCHEHHQMDNQ